MAEGAPRECGGHAGAGLAEGDTRSAKADGGPVAAHEISTDSKGEFDWTGGKAHEVIVRLGRCQFGVDLTELGCVAQFRVYLLCRYPRRGSQGDSR
jgi:hypothetical protein